MLKKQLSYFVIFFVSFTGISTQTKAQVVDLDLDAMRQHVFTTSGKVLDTAVDEISGVARWVLEWSIGEVFVEPLHGSKKRLTQGFHQSLPNNLSLLKISNYVFSVLDQEEIKQHFSVFPNPFVSNLSVKWNFEENLNLLFEIYALDGKRIFSQRHNAKNSQLLIQLNNLKPSTYILRITDPARGFIETHKIVKF
ncbi:MAG: T9SS type A sorting domain-containing protein [Bacteroidales bacterium]|nr:T9SS type A sorting domain-containing protein [Bacteroidales bacterium]